MSNQKPRQSLVRSNAVVFVILITVSVIVNLRPSVALPFGLIHIGQIFSPFRRGDQWEFLALIVLSVHTVWLLAMRLAATHESAIDRGVIVGVMILAAYGAALLLIDLSLSRSPARAANFFFGLWFGAFCSKSFPSGSERSKAMLILLAGYTQLVFWTSKAGYINYFYYHEIPRWSGFWLNPNVCGTLSVITGVWCIAATYQAYLALVAGARPFVNWAALTVGAFTACLYGVIVLRTLSRSAWTACLVIVIAWLAARAYLAKRHLTIGTSGARPRAEWLMVTIVLTVAVATLGSTGELTSLWWSRLKSVAASDRSVTNRFGILPHAMKLVATEPWGSGWDLKRVISRLEAMRIPTNVAEANTIVVNDFLGLFVTYGLVGGAVYLLLVALKVGLEFRAGRILNGIVILGFVPCALTNTVLFEPGISLLWWHCILKWEASPAPSLGSLQTRLELPLRAV